MPRPCSLLYYPLNYIKVIPVFKLGWIVFIQGLYYIFVKCKIFKEGPFLLNQPNAYLPKQRRSLCTICKLSIPLKVRKTIQQTSKKYVDNRLFTQSRGQNLPKNIPSRQVRILKGTLTLITSIIFKYQIQSTNEEAHTNFPKTKYKNHHCTLYWKIHLSLILEY